MKRQPHIPTNQSVNFSDNASLGPELQPCIRALFEVCNLRRPLEQWGNEGDLAGRGFTQPNQAVRHDETSGLAALGAVPW